MADSGKRLAPLLGGQCRTRRFVKGAENEEVWCPTRRRCHSLVCEYVKSGTAGSDSHAAPAHPPSDVRVFGEAAIKVFEITWPALADFESGLQRNSLFSATAARALARVPENTRSADLAGRLFQTMSYHDTPEKRNPVPLMALSHQKRRAGEGNTTPHPCVQ